MSTDRYILVNGKPVEEPDLMRWGQWMKFGDRIVSQDTIEEVKVSTVFLGLSHNFGEKGDPILWETMIFGGEHDQYMERYSSKGAALIGHNKALAMVSNSK